MVAGFAPIACPDARALVLGSLPSARSLEAGEYYAHPRNAFWPIMEALFGETKALDYAGRTSLLLANGVALWDVLRTAERSGSLDSSIVAGTERPNEFAAFLAQNPIVRTVFFNGGTARVLWDGLVAPKLPAELELRLLTLPSTSPANARLTFEGKLAAWRPVSEV